MKKKQETKQNSFNISRKIFHGSGIFIPLIFLTNCLDFTGIQWFEENTRSVLFYLLGVFSLFIIILEILRFNIAAVQRLFVRFLSPLLKKNEFDQINGSVAFFLANTILVGFFPKELAVISMIFLLFGDPAAAYFGSRYGKTLFWNGKSLEGSLAGVTASIIIGLLFLSGITIFGYSENHFVYLWAGNNINYGLLFSLIAGAVAAFIIEAVSVQGILDDNLLMPLGSSLVMMAALNLFTQYQVEFYSWSKLLIPFGT